MGAHTISVLNMKGGVGKTTLSTNLAIELYNLGHKVLLIDIDPQFNATQSLFKYYKNISEYFAVRDKRLTIADIFIWETSPGISRQQNPRNESNVIFELKQKQLDGNKTAFLHIIPGDLRLIVDVNAQAGDKLGAFFNRNKIKEKYDYIIFDCPPTWGQITLVSLGLSNYYLIPTALDDFSTIGVTLLSQLLQQKVESLATDLKCLGVVYTMLNETTATSGISHKQRPYKDDLEAFFEETMSEEVKSPVKAFDTVLYNYPAAVARSIIYESYEANSGNTTKRAEELHTFIKELTVEVLARINAPQQTEQS
ncbi:hypothetical protein GCM10007425_31170 [Lysinibacillus alkalisoli]|uniref:AAA domain-containing protein n=1 Tax=Lysinibacillus alkalisoli TaxID=1911548 RepID=A0A917GB55_9BACI|nr:AAA family ATPase [Lysinibacillus alkalisoli]GGG34211.1 hypothetical protein GCM10007425_31170 [Lysinibacillus alkalisoli]